MIFHIIFFLHNYFLMFFVNEKNLNQPFGFFFFFFFWVNNGHHIYIVLLELATTLPFIEDSNALKVASFFPQGNKSKLRGKTKPRIQRITIDKSVLPLWFQHLLHWKEKKKFKFFWCNIWKLLTKAFHRSFSWKPFIKTSHGSL